jgi:arsenite transporter
VRRNDPVLKGLSFLDRFLALWILLAMALGIILGYFVPSTQNVLNTAKFINVSAPIGMSYLRFWLIIAVGLIVMMYPILCKVRFEELHRTFSDKNLWVQLLFSFILNWIIAPLIMVHTSSELFSLRLGLLGLSCPTNKVSARA